MDFIALTTDQGAAFLFNIDNMTLIDPKNCQLYTVDNPAYGWTLSQKSMDDLMGAIQSHIVAADAPIPAPPIAPAHWDYPLPHVVKAWNPNDTPLEKVDDPASWASACEILEKLIELTEQKLELLGETLTAARKLEAAEAQEGIQL